MDRVAAEINDAKYIGLLELSEPSPNELRIVIEEAGPTDETDPAVPRPFEGLREIKRRPSDRTFVLVWDRYVTYAIRNESFARRDPYDHFKGQLFIEFSRSRFLEFVRGATLASDEYPGPLRHFGLICLDHVIDVVSPDEPQVSKA